MRLAWLFVARGGAASLAIERGFFSRGLPAAEMTDIGGSRPGSERAIKRIGATDIVNSCDDIANSRHNQTGVKMRGDIERP